ncbi:MAG: EpsG family protein [Bacteroides sp.]|nr:EpsG family protein [Bacteroides sp.]MBD5329453.1 EpsG family protein [Bacteroides sp.]
MFAAPYFNSFSSQGSAQIKINKESRIISLILLSLVFSIVFGMRWRFGTDYPTYLRIFLLNDTGPYKSEWLFKFINDCLYEFNVHYWIYFGIAAFIQIFLLFYTLKNEAYLWVFLILSLFGGLFFFDWMNGMRQELASCVMLFGTNYIIKKDPLKYLLCIIIATGFHISALIFLLMYPLLYRGKSIVPSRRIQILMLVICAAVPLLVGDFLTRLFPILDLMQQMEGEGGYASRYNENVLQKYSDETNIGIMFYIFFGINSLIICYSSKLKKYFSGRRILIYYNMYFWGMIFETLLASNMVLVRPFRYFRIYKLIMIAYLLYYFYKHPTRLTTTLLVTIIAILVVCMGIKVYTAPFNFFFDVPEAP